MKIFYDKLKKIFDIGQFKYKIVRSCGKTSSCDILWSQKGTTVQFIFKIQLSKLGAIINF